jgi:hypothetical protein
MVNSHQRSVFMGYDGCFDSSFECRCLAARRSARRTRGFVDSPTPAVYAPTYPRWIRYHKAQQLTTYEHLYAIGMLLKVKNIQKNIPQVFVKLFVCIWLKANIEDFETYNGDENLHLS